MHVDVYFNRTRKCWSVRANHRVIDHADTLVLVDCTMRVGETARRRVVETGKRGVHAWISGSCLTTAPASDIRAAAGNWQEIGYNPFCGKTFQIKASGHPVTAADLVRFEPDGRCFVAQLEPRQRRASGAV